MALEPFNAANSRCHFFATSRTNRDDHTPARRPESTPDRALDGLGLNGIDLLIAGCESGARNRPVREEWAAHQLTVARA
jgi:hypothetical protein